MFLVFLSQFSSFVLKWFDLVKRFPERMAKFGHLCFLLDTPSPRGRSARLGKHEALISKFMIRLGVDVLRLDKPLRLGEQLRLGEPLYLGVALLRLCVPANPVLFSLFF